jgi:hypothetical protein
LALRRLRDWRITHGPHIQNAHPGGSRRHPALVAVRPAGEMRSRGFLDVAGTTGRRVKCCNTRCSNVGLLRRSIVIHHGKGIL